MQIVLDRPIQFGETRYRAGEIIAIDDSVAMDFASRGMGYLVQPPPPVERVGISGPGSVTCMMPTRNRREWISRAIRLFNAQTYQNAELLVLDNGESIHDLIPAQTNIRYVRLAAKQTIGQLRNYCAQLSEAEYIAHWDDDDWYHPARLEEQIASLGDKQVIVYDQIMMEGEAGAYEFNGKAPESIPGSSLLYRRSWWDSHRFLALRAGEDTKFSVAAAEVIKGVDGRSRMVASIHDKHTSPRVLSAPAYRKVERAELPKEFSN